MTNKQPTKNTDPRYIGALNGKFVLPDRGADGRQPAVQTGRSQSISPHEVAIQSTASLRTGERISAVFDQVGRIDGIVARKGLGGFVVDIIADDKRRAELAKTIEWLKKKHTKAVSDQRDATRAITGTLICLATFSGGSFKCQLVDISASGAGLRCSDDPPAVGEEIRIGEVSGTVARHTPSGFGIEFDDRQELNLLLGKLTAGDDRP